MSKKVEPGRVDPRSTAATAGLENSLVGMSGFRAEPPHVAQQSRRDKLRVQPIPVASIPDHLLVRDVYDPALFSSSSMLDFSAQEASSFVPNPSTSNFHDGNTSVWKGLGSQPTCDWITSCVGVGGVAPIQSALFPSHLYPLKPGISGYQDVPSGDLSGQGAQKQYGDLHFASPSFCHNALEEAVTSSSPSVGHQGIEISPLVQPNIREVSQPWVDSASELLLLPSYGNQVSTTRLESTAVWLSRQPQQWNSEEAFARHKNDGGLGAIPSDGTTQGLALSLSSNPLPELQVAQFEDRFGHEDFTTRANIVQDLHTSRVNDVGISTSYPKFAVSDRGYGNSTEGVVGSSMDARRGAGPLGPFTGYATILKSSKFLKPAQQLLDEFCSVVTGLKLAKQCDVPERSSGVVSGTCDAPVAENGFGGRGRNSGGSSSSFFSSTEATGQGGAGAVASPIQRPEFQQKKAKLLYMQEEVCRRYKQYHQQMQMVISSFESVSGLSAATPYASLALKAVSKHFRCLRNAISDQVRHISKMLGEEFMSFPGSDTTGNAILAPRLKFVEQSLRKQKTGDRGSSFLDHAQPVWRPQRGLPERSVAVLRAWLFEHFLHPYPTDTDKHMLASQTGLSRNQVSNWFINARVRLWKPMVEEIHMLETKGLTEMDLNSANKNDSKPANPSNNGGQPSSHQRSEAQCCKPSDCTSMGAVPNNESYQTSIVQWQQKRSRMEDCMVPEGVDGGLMSFAYEGGMDLGGRGAVSLTLGLQHNEGASMVHQQQQQQQMRRHFGGQMLHDFVG